VEQTNKQTSNKQTCIGWPVRLEDTRHFAFIPSAIVILYVSTVLFIMFCFLVKQKSEA